LASGRLAADAVLKAKQEGDFSQGTLAHYHRLLEESFVLKELRRFKNAPKTLSNPRLYADYPSWLHETLKELYTVGEGPRDSVGRILWRAVRKGPPLGRILGDLWSMRHL
jgi:electron transfer flavoprotein-quinone oxidoreductase